MIAIAIICFVFGGFFGMAVMSVLSIDGED